MADIEFSSDKSRHNPTKDDELDRARFAEHLAKSLLKMSPVDGFVVAIYGAWGSGKTTLLEYVTYYLEQRPKEDRPIVIPFNPWWFSGREALVRHFFAQLQSRFDKKAAVYKGLRKGFGQLGEIASKAPIPGAEIAGSIGNIVTPKEQNVADLKKHIESLLKKLTHRVVVVIDDIDRLPVDEVGEMFRIIKAIGDLPNITYLLAFDKQRTSDAIHQSLSLPGEEYLEKIVQLAIDLPLPDKNLLKRILRKQLHEIIEDFPDEVFNPPSFAGVRWSSTYVEFTTALDYFITTPRDIARLTNALKATFPAVKGEVHAVDFVGIELLRLFCPEMYDVVRRNPSQFVGSSRPLMVNDSDREFYESQLQEFVTDEKDRPVVADLLAYLFPRVMILRHGAHSSSDERKLRLELRVASRDIFPIYFQFNVPGNSMSRAEINGYLAVASDPQEFTKVLNSLIDRQDEKIALFLNALTDAKDTEPIRSHIPAVIEALLNVGDTLASGGNLSLGELVLDLWLVLNERERYGVLENAVRTGKSLLGVTGMVIILGGEFGKFKRSGESYRPDERHVTAEQLKSLEEIVLNRIHQATEDKTLRQVPNFSLVKLAWQEWAGLDEPTAWLTELTSNDEGILCLIRQSMMPDIDAPEKPRFPYVRYNDALDLDSIAKRLEALVEANSLAPIDRAFSASFLEYYPNFKARPQEQ